MDTTILMSIPVVCLLLLMTKKLFWMIALPVVMVGCIFSIIACLIHFQILAAMGFFVILLIAAFLTSLIADL